MKFKKGFLLGAATAAHQVEGNNIHSDYWVQENIEHSVFDEPSLDAVDHYNRYEEDIRFMAEAGLNAYRFSIEWARIQPNPDKWEEKEIQHYKDVIACCRKYNIEPMVTLHHFSSPKWLVSEGGWENPTVIDRFTEYSQRLIREIGNEINYVCTINEANMRLQLTALIKDMMNRMVKVDSKKEDNNNGLGEKKDTSDVQVGVNLVAENMKLNALETAQAFGIQDPRKVYPFISQCTKEGDLLVMKAHESARDAIKQLFPHLKVGLSLSLHDFHTIPGGESFAEKEWEDEFTHYLPFIQKDDFLGVQCYSKKTFGPEGIIALGENEPRTQMGYADYPEAIVNVTRKVHEMFNGELIITENGIATDNDERRCEFINEAVNGIHNCIEDGIPVKGYMYWSLLDNFEWQKGYKMTFGLIGVDRTTQTRSPKRSLSLLGELIDK